MSKNEKGFCIFFDWIDDLDYLSGDNAWKVIKALSGYYRDGTNPVENVEAELKATVSLMFHQIQRAEAISEIRSDAAKSSKAIAKGSKAIAKLQQSSTTETYTETETYTDNSNTPPTPSRGDDERFEKFWKAYPKKIGKGAALKAFKKINPSAELLEIMINAIEIQKQSQQWTKDGGQFIPNPATWLSQKRWEDEPQSGPYVSVPSAGGFSFGDYLREEIEKERMMRGEQS